jgi:hypothetical protein
MISGCVILGLVFLVAWWFVGLMGKDEDMIFRSIEDLREVNRGVLEERRKVGEEMEGVLREREEMRREKREREGEGEGGEVLLE